MRSSPALVLGSAAVAILGIACSQKPAPSPAPAPAPVTARPTPQQQPVTTTPGEETENPTTPTVGGRGGRGGQGGGVAQAGGPNPQPYNRMLHFERRDNRVLLRGISNEIMASDTLSPVAGAVAASNVHPVIAIFNVEAYGPDSAPVIDVTRLFTQPPTELSPAQRIGAGYQIDATRSWIERSA